jgi:hypothetical protein
MHIRMLLLLLTYTLVLNWFQHVTETGAFFSTCQTGTKPFHNTRNTKHY